MRISVGICRAAQFARVSALCVPGRKRAGIGVPKMSRRTNQGIPQGGQPPPYRQVARCHTLLRSHYSILSVVCQRVCRKVFGIFLLFSLAVVQDAQCVVGFLCKSAKGVVFWGGRGGGGLAFFVACLLCRFGIRRGACLFGRLLTLPLVLFPAPIPPTPFPSGEGGDYSYLMQGAPPLASPGLNLRFAAKTIGSGSLLAVPAAKERGDRGRWNYPSQATAAFEMVLSPGAGIASAAGKSALHASAGYSRGRLCKCRKRFSAGVPGAKPPAK